jgi:hypothetical protein
MKEIYNVSIDGTMDVQCTKSSLAELIFQICDEGKFVTEISLSKKNEDIVFFDSKKNIFKNGNILIKN